MDHCFDWWRVLCYSNEYVSLYYSIRCVLSCFWIISGVFYAFYGPRLGFLCCFKLGYFYIFLLRLTLMVLVWSDFAFYLTSFPPQWHGVLIITVFYSCVLFFGGGRGVGRCLLHKVIRDVNAIRSPKFNPIVLFFLQTLSITSIYILLYFCENVTTGHISISENIK